MWVWVWLSIYAPFNNIETDHYTQLLVHEYDDDDEEPHPHIPKDGFPFGVSWVAHGLDLVAHKDLQEYLDSQARKQAQFYILQRARCMVVMIFSYIFIHLLYIHICITSHKINSLFLIFFFTTTILLTVVLGTNLLLFTFPMMFIGAVSCIYLHLIQQNRTEKLPSTRFYIYICQLSSEPGSSYNI